MSTPGTTNYPTSVDDEVSLFEVTNLGDTALTSALSAGATTANVTSTAEFPDTGAITIFARDGAGVETGHEILYYTGKTSTSFTGLIRGRDGTAAAIHASGDIVESRVTAGHHRTIAEAIIATQAELDAQVATLAASILALDSAKADVATTLAGYGITDAAALVHTHDDRYFTEPEADARFAAAVHTHDDRYFTETESDARFAALSHVHALTDITGLISAGKIATGLLPALAITDTFVVASQAAMLALTAETGDIAVRSDQSKTYILKGSDPTQLANWELLQTPTDAVLSVNGQTGIVSLTASDVGALTQATADGLYSVLAHTHTFASLTSKPTTLAGYGILDAAAAVHAHAASDITSGILTSAVGGTGNGFTKFAGPASAERTFTLPNASATILTDNAAVSIAQGGTGQATAANAINALLPTQTGESGKYLTTNGTVASWATVSASDATKLPLAGGTMSGAILLAAGAVGTPSLSIDGDSNTGMWSPAADTLAWSTAGSERMRLTSSGGLMIGMTALPSGISSQPLLVDTAFVTARAGNNDYSGPAIDFYRARGSLTSPSNIASGDYLGDFFFRGRVAGAYSILAGFGAKADSSSTGYMYFSRAGLAESMRIDSTGSVHIGAAGNADAKALLDVASTTKGFLPPRMTTTQRDAITSSPSGLMVYNTTTGKLNVRGAAAWEEMTSA